ncbi:type-1 angiotensin II receptor-associated protein-like [Diabrotica undecimpunctata]|uniref:type-1 angiotensin II receptor-associated protein-like n=1 Tax=Diabrotica undecimpunctata TaxID=50387 RepID=UPI003B638A17
MPELSQIRNFRLKILFLIHFIFISLSTMGYWSSNAYLFYNSLLILLFLWSLYHDQSHEPIQLAIVVNGSSIFLDILILVMGFPSSDDSARNKFSAAMAILHLIIRPFSTILLIKNLEERSGATGVLTGIFPGGNSTGSDAYEDLDRPVIPQSSGKTGGYDFSSAQQI